MEKFFAPCPRGLEAALASELAALGAQRPAVVEGGVGFNGEFSLCYAANLESRIASRVLWQVGLARYRDEHAIYAASRALPWPSWFDVHRSIRVNVAAIRSPLKSLDFATLRIKDAVCDAFRDTLGERPELKDTVTVRRRDDGSQDRVPIAELRTWLEARLR